MADVRNGIDRPVKLGEAVTRKAAAALAAAAGSVDEETLAMAKQTYDRIKTAREARDRKRVKAD